MEAKHQSVGYDKNIKKGKKKELIKNIANAETLKIESIANKSKESVVATEGEAYIVGIVNEMIEGAEERTKDIVEGSECVVSGLGHDNSTCLSGAV